MRSFLENLRKTFAHWMNAAMSRALNSWKLRLAEYRTMLRAAVRLLSRRLLAVLNTWKGDIDARERNRNRMVGALETMRGSKRRGAYNEWRSKTVDARRALAPMARGLAHFLNRKLSKGWVSWTAFVARHAKVRGIAATLSPEGRNMRAALNTWVAFADAAAARRRRLGSALNELAGCGCRKGWNRWREFVDDIHRMGTAASRFFLREASRAFAAWAETAGGMATRAARARGALRSLSPEGRALRMGLNSWMERAAQGAKMRRAASSMLNKGLKLGLNSWAAWVDKRHEQMALLHRAAHGIGSNLLRAFLAWAARLEEGDDTASRALKHLMNRQLSGGWNSWCATVQLTMLAASAVARLRCRKLKMAVNSWAAILDGDGDLHEKVITQARRMKAATTTLRAINSWKEKGRQYRLMRNAGQGFRNGGIKRGLNGWAAYTEERLEMLRKLTKGAAGLRNGNLRKAWSAWEETAFRPDPMGAALSRWANGALVAGLLRWKAATEEALIMLKGVLGMRNGKLKLCWNTWGSWLEERLAKRAAIAAALKGMASGLRAPFNSWKAIVDGSGDPRERALRYLRNRKVPPAWNTWVAVVERKRQLRKALSGMTNAPLRRSFNGWSATAAAQADKAARIGAVLASLSPEGRAKRKALNSWGEMVAKAALMRKAGGSFFYRKARLAFNGWAETVASLLERRERAMAALARLSPEGRAMTKALNTWIARKEMHRLLLRAGAALFYAKARKAFTNWDFVVQQRYHIEATLFRVMNQKLAKAFNTWVNCDMKPSPMKKAGGRMRNRPLSMAFNQWVAIYEAMMFLQRSMAHLVYGGLSKGLRMWLEYLDLRDVMARAAFGLRNGGLKRGFNAWVEHTEQRLEFLMLLERGVGGMRAGPKKAAFNTWADKTFGEPDPMFRALAHFVHREMSAGFLAWVEATAVWLVMMNALSALKNREARKGYNSWLLWAEERKEKQARLKAILTRMSSPAVRAFNKWAHVLEMLGPIRQAAFRLRNRNLVKAVGSWHGLMLEKRRMRQALVAMDPQKRAMRDMLRAWRGGGDAEDKRLARLLKKGNALIKTAEMKALNSWKAQWAELCELRRALGGILNGRLKRGMNAWLAQNEAARAKRAQLASTLKKASPEGRAMMKAINSWSPKARCWRKMKGVAFALRSRHVKMGMVTWRAWYEDGLAERAKMRAALVALSPEGRKKRAAMNKLKACLDMYRLLLRAGSALFNSKVKKAINNWAFVVEQTYRMMDSLAAVANAKLQRAFNTWHTAPPHPAKKSLARWKNKPLSKAFNQWVEIYEAMMYARRSLSHMVNSGLSKGWRMWLEYLELRDVMARAAFGLRNGGLKRCMNGWVVYTEQRFEMLAVMERGIGGMRGGPLKKAYNKWAELIYGPPNPLYRALAHLVYRELSRALLAWVDAKDRWVTMKGAMKRLFNRQLSQCFESWQERMEEAAARRQRMSHVLAGFQGGLRKAFNQWAHVLELLAPLRAGLNRLIHRQTSMAFESWQAMWEEMLLMKKALASVLHAPLKRGWNAWLELLEAQAAKRDLAKKAVLRTTPQGKAFFTWAEQMRALLPLKRSLKHWSSMQLVKAMGSWDQLMQDVAAKRRALAGFFSAGSKKAINAWKGFAAERRDARDRARAALVRLSPEGRKKSKGFNAWLDMLETMAMMRKAGAAIFYRKVRKALNNWDFITQQQHRIQAALFRVMNAKLLRCFNSWRKSPTKPTPMKKAVARMRNGPMAKAFDAWWSRLEDYYRARRSLSHLVNRALAQGWRSWEEFLITRELFAKAGAKLLNMGLSKGFNGWFAWVESKLEKKAKMEAIAQSMKSGKRKAFNSWAELVGNVNPRERALRHMMNSALSKGWRRWEAMIIAIESARRALAHFAGQGLVKALGSWEEFVESKRLMRSAGAALFMAASKKCVNKWVDFVLERQERRERMSGVLAGFQGKTRKAWNSWCAHVETMLMMRGSMRRLVNRQLSQCFESWQFAAEALVANRARMRAALYGASSGLRKVLNSWLEYLEMLRLARKALGGLRNGGLKKGLGRWLEWCDQRAEIAERARNAIMKTTPAGKALNTWVAYIEAQAPMRRSLAHMRNKGLSKCWYGWFAYLEMLDTKRSCLAHLFNRELSRGWRGWQQRMAEAELMRVASARLQNREACAALRRWAGSAAAREEKLRLMRGTLYVLGDGYKVKKCLNSWIGFLEMNRKVLKGLVALTRRSEYKAWNRWYDRCVKAAEVRAKMRGALSIALRKGMNSWKEVHAGVLHAKASMAHWKNAGLYKSWRKWSGGLGNLAQIRRSLKHLMQHNLVKGLNSWLLFMERRATMRSALMSLVRASSRKALNSWIACAAQRKAQRERASAALFTLKNVPLRKALNSIKALAVAMQPLKRAMAHWRNVPLTKARPPPSTPTAHHPRRHARMIGRPGSIARAHACPPQPAALYDALWGARWPCWGFQIPVPEHSVAKIPAAACRGREGLVATAQHRNLPSHALLPPSAPLAVVTARSVRRRRGTG